ncbi:Uncharacterized protein Cob_v000863 [Colletotrichum orbiculare MAFF 240422]|uniref:Plasma membrane channel protein n=1 Tax=Colletotrichum orbiculare (strain 104-T / ATCC 96160 / CBS 514.97 / LARS 414 / MAFF 240422) TaxID=1213857 RepID=A0A484G796_COLOR|nr:Uncharacterized protein Cob_v000863 [Colletotrichum orbiculare MAFF 240422]
MASLRSLYSDKDDAGLTSNFGVDYVINYKIPEDDRANAEATFVQLIEGLTNVGLTTEVRRGGKHAVLIFVKIASAKFLADQVYRSRLQDWLHGARTVGPDTDLSQALRDEPVSDAERLRLVYLLIVKPKNEGGAGITPQSGRWKHVDCVFPLHDHAFNKQWIKKMSTKGQTDEADLDEIRDRFGENVAFYFAFMHSYFKFLIFPAGAGFAAWMFFGQFSWLYALTSCLWSVVFFEFWKKKEVDLAVQWGVRGVSNIQHPRPQFEFERQAEDPITGEAVKIYSPIKRLQTQLLQIPFAAACIVVLGTLIVTCNSLEIFINEVYNGPFQAYLGFLPTIILVVLTPTFSTVLTKFATRLTEMENYETIDTHHAALVQKEFVLNFLTSYMALFFTAFVYLPFGDRLTPYLDIWRATAQKLTPKDVNFQTQEFVINPERISKQMFYFTVTAQVVNFATEVIVPYVKRQVFQEVREVQSKMAKEDDAAKIKDPQEEAAFLERVRNEVELETYDVTGDYREMVIQFGYLSLFSVAWPLTACCFLVNNWVEMRSDAVKIAISSRRPIPWRADSIGPWLNALGFLSWLGSITSASIVFLCSSTGDGPRGAPSGIKVWGLLLSILLAEHFYFAVQFLVRLAFRKLDSPGLQKERKERFLMKKRLLQQNLGQEVSDLAATPGIEKTEEITFQALEEEARRLSTQGHGGAEDAFWRRQRGMAETIQIGRSLIAQSSSGNQTTA